MAADKTDEFQQQALEMLRAQQGVAAVRRGAKRSPAASRRCRRPRPSRRRCTCCRRQRKWPRPITPSRRSCSPSKAVSWTRSARQWRRRRSRDMTERRPWLGLYHSVPPSIEPKARTGLEMFRHTVAAHRDAALVHYFDRSSTAGQLDAWSDALALRCRNAAPSLASASPCPAEHPAGVCRRALPGWAPSSSHAIRCCASAS